MWQQAEQAQQHSSSTGAAGAASTGKFHHLTIVQLEKLLYILFYIIIIS
jgi:hypothetical protein